MFEVKRLSKIVEKHDTNTSQLLHQIHGSTLRNSFSLAEYSSSQRDRIADDGGRLRVNTRLGGPDQLTPPTKDTSSYCRNYDSTTTTGLMSFPLPVSFLIAPEHRTLFER